MEINNKYSKKWEKSFGLYYLNKDDLEKKLKEIYELEKELKIKHLEFSKNLELKVIQVSNCLKSLKNIKNTRYNNKLRKDSFNFRN
jgi:hypothetical protein